MLSKTFIKYIQSLHHKKFRDEEGVFIAEGVKVVKDFLTAENGVCRSIVALSDWLHSDEAAFLKQYDVEVETAEEFELEKISALSTPNKILAVFSKPEIIPFSPKGKITLLLDTIQDPGNMGTIIRIADWFGIQNIVCSMQCADVYNPKVVQSTMGSLLRVNIMHADLKHWISAQKDQLKIYATSLQGKNIKDIGPVTEAAVLIGNESKGVNDELIKCSHQQITIPLFGKAESLNAAVATGIILSHIR